MLLNGCSSISGSISLKHKAWPAKSYVALSRSSCHFPSNGIKNSRGSGEKKLWSSRGTLSLNLSASSTPLLKPLPITRRKPILPLRAVAKDGFSTEKPKWWLRSIACLQYLYPIHSAFEIAEMVHYLHHPLSESYLPTYSFLCPPAKFSNWYTIVYVLVALSGYLPSHILRSHTNVGMFLAIFMREIIGNLIKFPPLAVYWSKMGLHFWTTIAVAYLFVVLECMRRALNGDRPSVAFEL